LISLGRVDESDGQVLAGAWCYVKMGWTGMGWTNWGSDGLAGVLSSVDFSGFRLYSGTTMCFFSYKSKAQIVLKDMMLARRVT
jgi:hypothetical protein